MTPLKHLTLIALGSTLVGCAGLNSNQLSPRAAVEQAVRQSAQESYNYSGSVQLDRLSFGTAAAPVVDAATAEFKPHPVPSDVTVTEEPELDAPKLATSKFDMQTAILDASKYFMGNVKYEFKGASDMPNKRTEVVGRVSYTGRGLGGYFELGLLYDAKNQTYYMNPNDMYAAMIAFGLKYNAYPYSEPHLVKFDMTEVLKTMREEMRKNGKTSKDIEGTEDLMAYFEKAMHKALQKTYDAIDESAFSEQPLSRHDRSFGANRKVRVVLDKAQLKTLFKVYMAEVVDFGKALNDKDTAAPAIDDTAANTTVAEAVDMDEEAAKAADLAQFAAKGPDMSLSIDFLLGGQNRWMGSIVDLSVKDSKAQFHVNSEYAITNHGKARFTIDPTQVKLVDLTPEIDKIIHEKKREIDESADEAVAATADTVEPARKPRAKKRRR